MVPFLFGLIAIGVAWWFLFHLKQRDVAACRDVLGLSAASAESRRGTTPEGLAYVERALLQGVLEARPARLWERTVRHRRAARRTGSQFTVLELTLDSPARCALRIQPTGLLGAIESFVGGPSPDRVAIDQEFDQAYVVYSINPTAALVALTPGLRQRLLAFRTAVAGNVPSSVVGPLASGLILGTFYVDGGTASYAVFGSATKATAEHVKAAAPLLAALSAAAGA